MDAALALVDVVAALLAKLVVSVAELAAAINLDEKKESLKNVKMR
jgi:hypothetical protein